MVELTCEQGDIVSINFDPSLNHEPAGRHYGIVLTTWQANARSALTLVAPVTSTDNGHPFHVRIADDNDIFGFVQCEGIRAIGLATRELNGAVEVVGALDSETLGAVLDVVLVMLGQQ